MDTHCHHLKHDIGAAQRLLTEMQMIKPKKVSQSILQGLQDAIT